MIEIYKKTDFKKNGELKKRAKPVFSYMTTEDTPDYKHIANLIKNNGFYEFTKPNYFIYIKANSKDFGDVIISQYFLFEGNKKMFVTPQNLWEALVY
jgi:hypothetical protein